jgi:hypothetical protein
MLPNKTPFPQSRRLIKPDGTKAISWDNKLHNWDGPALITPDGKKEYYIYGIQYTLEDWKERKRQREGLPFYKDPQFRGQIRF